MNSLKVGFLMTILTTLLIFLGRLIGGPFGMMLAFIVAIIMNFSAYWFSDKIVLSMYKAKEVAPNQHPDLYRIVKRLVYNANLPMPKIYIIPDPTCNAFATGRNPQHSAVAVTQGLLQTLSSNETSGVLGHELAHIKNRDILISSIAATFAGAITILANIAQWSAIFGFGSDNDDNRSPLTLLLMAILAPMASLLIQMAISRSREYQADKVGAKIHGNPLDLASALSTLHNFNKHAPKVRKFRPSTAHLFIDNPLKGSIVANLFSTHPLIEERVRRLNLMSKNQ